MLFYSSRDEELESCSRSQKNCAKYDKQRQPVPINLYAVGAPDTQPLDIIPGKLGDPHSVQHMPRKEVTRSF